MSSPAPLFPFQPIAEYRAYKSEIDEAIQRVLDSGLYILGPEVEAFEREFAAQVGAPHAVGVGNGTDALILALHALGIGEGDTVITVSHTAVATVAAIEWVGAHALLVDIDPVTYTMAADQLEETIRQNQTGRLKAIIPVHLYGHPADLPAVFEIASRHGLRVIEDCAQSHGASLAGRATGTWGDLAAFSFYPTKNLGAIGDGGAVVTKDARLAAQVRRLRQYGWEQRYVSAVPGMNSRLDELQAAILRVKCRHLPRLNQRRRELAALYSGGLDQAKVTTPTVRRGAQHVFHQYVIRTPRRDSLQEFWRGRGVPTAIHYPQPVHAQPAYLNRVAVGVGGLAETERACREVLSLPMHAQLTDEAVNYALQQLEEWLP